ncbi:MAG: site-specific DNA-methyltransferase [Nitrospirae bacterium YQR-1]
MQNLLHDLMRLLEQDDRLVVEGQLLKNKIVELALGMDSGLIRLLLTHKGIRRHFFTDIDGVLVFDKIKFQQFVSNKDFLPDSYTTFKNKIGLTADGRYLTDSKEVVLAWPYKDCVLEGGQTKEDAKRNEIFWNETLAPDQIDRLLSPKVLTNFKRYDRGGEHKVSTISLDDNLVIKGNNLLALHTLKGVYAGQVKLIYIDPPYNTDGDDNVFSYNNTFNHSTWLVFIKNRLTIAKEFLSNDGFIVIAIDHAELFYLGVLADEVFGRDNRISIVTVEHNPKGRNQAEFFSANSEFMLVYAKNKFLAEFNSVAINESVKALFNEFDEEGSYRWEPFIRARTVWSRENKPNNWYPIYVSKDLKHITSEPCIDYYEIYPTTSSGEFSWKKIKQSFNDLNKGDYFKATRDGDKIVLLHKYREQQVLKNVWTDKRYHSEFNGTNLLKKLIGKTKFSYPKSIYAVIDVIKIMTNSDDLVMDFFAGSSTTAHAVLQVNKDDKSDRKFICIEQLDEHVDVSIRRLKAAIKGTSDIPSIEEGAFVYCELLRANQIFVDRIQAAKATEVLQAIWSEMQDRAFLSYKIDPKTIDLNSAEFNTLSLEDQQRFLIEVLDKNMLYVPLSEMDDETYGISIEDKKLNRQFFSQR